MIKILRPDSIWGRSDIFNLVPKLSSSKEMRGKVSPQKSLFSVLQNFFFTSISAHDYVSLKAFWWLIMCLTLPQFVWKLNSANNNDCIKQDSNLSSRGSTFCILLRFNAAFLSMDSFGEGLHYIFLHCGLLPVWLVLRKHLWIWYTSIKIWHSGSWCLGEMIIFLIIKTLF